MTEIKEEHGDREQEAERHVTKLGFLPERPISSRIGKLVRRGGSKPVVCPPCACLPDWGEEPARLPHLGCHALTRSLNRCPRGGSRVQGVLPGFARFPTLTHFARAAA